MKNIKSYFLELIEVIVIALLIVIPIRMYLVTPFFVRGQSMEPNFQDSDYLIIDKLSFRFSQPERGDIIVFKAPLDPKSFYIKRIIGLPNETIEVKDGKLVVFNTTNENGVELKEVYLNNHPNTPGNIKIKLKTDEFFVLGDNREASYDSRE
jgi:signal peptidase I